jgi:type VI secretion system secreted protein Hcp
MEDILVSHVSTGGSHGEDRLTENVTLNFAKFKTEYQEQKQDGSGGPKTEAKWDIPAGKPA